MTDTTNTLSQTLRPLAVQAMGHTGADIERIVREARQVARRKRRPLTWQDIETSLAGRQARMPEDLLWRVCLHEAGHAVAWSVLGVGEVLSVTIGIETMGQVVTRRVSDVAQTECWLTRMIACILAGRVCEHLLLGDFVAGAGGNQASDLAKATEYALAAETTLGFSSVDPLLYRNSSGSLDLLSIDRALADRVHTRLVLGETLARDVLQTHRDPLLQIAERLRGKGVMEGTEVRQMLGLTEE
ncbi:ATP-dependent Zn protease [Rhizobium sp. LjRoot30]|uniref:ATP-dependent Zn protease n=1 Tax=Rhizobium sp. LjRoot30 TaxID=3342320 RepID=UPI003ECDD1E7